MDTGLPLAGVRRKYIENIEKDYLRQLLELNKGRIKETAKAAGITTLQVHKLLTKYSIHKEDYKNNPITQTRALRALRQCVILAEKLR